LDDTYECPLLAVDSTGSEGQLPTDSVEKVGFLKLPKNWSVKAPFSTLLREISVRMPLLKLWISISGAYIFAMATKADFFNRIGQKQSLFGGCFWHQRTSFSNESEQSLDGQ